MKKILVIVFLFMFLPIYINAETLNLSNAQAKFTGEAANDNAGYTVTGVGDVNSDGYADFVINAYQESSSAKHAGAVYLFYGKNELYSGIFDLKSADAKFIGPNSEAHAGKSIAALGDVNNDGYADFLIGVPGASVSGGSENQTDGKAFLIYGQKSKYSGDNTLNSSWPYFAASRCADIGDKVAAAGDVNGDGYADFLIAPFSNGGYSDKLFLVYGQENKFSGDNNLDLISAEFRIFETDDLSVTLDLGAINGAGDINGDGFTDMLIGTPSDTEGGYYAGAIYIVYGQAEKFTGINYAADLAATKFIGSSDYYNLGRYGVNNVGDINSDGYSDVIIDCGSSACLYYGRATWNEKMYISDSNAVFTGESDSSTTLGESAVSAGDVNNDGYPDLLFGDANYNPSDDEDSYGSGAAYLVSGQAEEYSGTIKISDSMVKLEGENVGDGAGHSVASAGDVNGDGYKDILIGALGESTAASNAGAAYLIYVQVDSDGDGVPSKSGILPGSDADDNNENTTGLDQVYSELGKVIISYTDGSTSEIKVFKSEMTLLPYRSQSKHYYLALSSNGKKMALINIYNLKVVDKLTISKKAYSKQKFQIIKKGSKKYAVAVLQEGKKIFLSINNIIISQQKLTVHNSAKTTLGNVSLEKTSIGAKYIKLNNAQGKILATYNINQHKLTLK